MKFFFSQALLLDLFLFAGWGVSVLFFGKSSNQDPIPPMLFDVIPLAGGLICLIVLSLISAFYIRSRKAAIAWIATVTVAPLFLWFDFELIRNKRINNPYITDLIENFMTKYVAAPFIVTISCMIFIEYIIAKIPMVGKHYPMGEKSYKEIRNSIFFFYALFCMIVLGRSYVEDSHKTSQIFEFACVFFGIIAMPAVALKIDDSLAKAAASFSQKDEKLP